MCILIFELTSREKKPGLMNSDASFRVLHILLSMLLAGTGFACSEDLPSPPPPGGSDTTKTPIDTLWTYDAADTLCVLVDGRITELSGIAPSRKRDGLYWLHNDSGGEARIFAMDSTGSTLAVCALKGATNVDWEDIANVDHAGTSWLYVADVGDNDARRQEIVIYRTEEAEVSSSWQNQQLSRQAEHAVFTYEDGPRDCEALMVDPADNSLWLIEKSSAFTSGVYRATWPGDGKIGVFRRVAEIAPPFSLGILRRITAADLRPDRGAMLIRTYGGIVEFYSPPQHPIPALLGFDSSALISYPHLPRPEAACYRRDGAALIAGSEGKHTPIIIVRRK